MADDVAMSDSDPDRHPVDLLAEEFAARCRRGEHVSVSDYASEHPEFAAELREVLPPIALMEKLKKRNVSGGGSSGASPAGGALKLERLGDFRIVREVGRGGMGIVYEAVQESLDRHVALKVLSRASMLDPQRVQRFEQEARAAAGLHHTNIVPVFGVGEHDGLHYLVLQLIEGRSLAEVIGELAGAAEHPGAPTVLAASAAAGSGAVKGKRESIVSAGNGAFHPPAGRRYWRWAADVARQAADALHYAHRQGVLHRDVKPANLLLDERGMVWITDFGLAKLGETQSVTRTGDVIGTLQYMAPEGLRSQADARSDIYGLGLTLYEMLTLRPAMQESTPAALLRRVAEGELARPRKVNPAIPADLETIVLKATARDPASRYATAADLAEDLENYLHDRPIAARRTPVAERLWRWCRRNRAIAALAALAVACAVAAIVVGWTAYGVTKRALSAEASKRREAEIQKRRADENVALSLKSFEAIFNQLAPEDELPLPARGFAGGGPRRGGGGEGGGGMGPPGGGKGGQPGERATDAALLKSILGFYDRFAEQNATNPALQAEAAKSYRRVGDGYLHMAQTAEADAAYRRSAAMYDELLKAFPDNEAYQQGVAEAAIRLGVEQPTLKADDAQTIHRAAELAETLRARHPKEAKYNELAARVLLREGDCQRQAGHWGVAEENYRRSMEAWKAGGPPAPPPQNAGGGGGGGRRAAPPPRPPEGYAAPLALAELLVEEDRIDEAAAAVQEAMAELERTPVDAPGAGRLPAVFERLAKVAESAGDADLAQRARQRAAQLPPPGEGPRGPRDPREGPPPLRPGGRPPP